MNTDFVDFQKVQRLELVKAVSESKSVLHLGCTNAPYTREAIDSNMLLHHDLSEISRELYGFDQDFEGIEILRSTGSKNLFEADLEHLEKVDLEKTFDVIIAGEMIEHLTNPGLFLNGIKRFMNSETKLVITTINAYCALRFVLYGLRGKGGRNEPVHPDHVSYYSYSTLKLLLQKHGLTQNSFLFYDLGDEHRPHNPWYLNLINDVAVRFSPQLSDGVIAVCSLSGESNDA